MNEDAPVEPAAVHSNVAIWDLPTRLFHWLLAILVAFSWWSAEEHQTELHVWSGIAILTLLVFRLLWGFFGSSTARFASFIRGPRSVADYLRGRWRGIGHSPLGALSVVALLVVTSIQVGLGLFSSDEDGIVSGPLASWISIDASEEVRDLHDDFFDILLVFVGLHIAAVLFYRLVLGQKLIRAMITGRGKLDPDLEPMRPGHWWVALLCLAVAVGIARWVVAGAPPFGP